MSEKEKPDSPHHLDTESQETVQWSSEESARILVAAVVADLQEGRTDQEEGTQETPDGLLPKDVVQHAQTQAMDVLHRRFEIDSVPVNNLDFHNVRHTDGVVQRLNHSALKVQRLAGRG